MIHKCNFKQNKHNLLQVPHQALSTLARHQTSQFYLLFSLEVHYQGRWAHLQIAFFASLVEAEHLNSAFLATHDSTASINFQIDSN